MLDGAVVLDTLNHAAVSGSREQPHNEVARRAAGGTAGLYALHTGKLLQTSMRNIQYALWFGKPSGMRYDEFFARVVPQVERSGGCLWQRYMTLGPAPEFCWQSENAEMLGTEFGAVSLLVRRIFLLLR